MPYTLERLAPGSYDVLLDGKAVAALVSETNRAMRTTWVAELLDEPPGGTRPAPFTKGAHKFDSLGAACEWLGVERPA
jgi:hypothetical protein